MNNVHPLLLCDGYKISHHRQYPDGTTLVYSNFTPRSNKHAKTDKVVSIGQQALVRWLKEYFDEYFFARHKVKHIGEMLDSMDRFEDPYAIAKAQVKNMVISSIKEELELYLGTTYDVTHFEKLWDLGYLPLVFKALPEGTVVPMKVPVLTVYNTHPDFAWLPNYLETIISNQLWQVMTSASIALKYKSILKEWAKKTNPDAIGFVDFQAHDFSMRGMSSLQSTQLSGLGHMAVFSGSDNLPAISTARHYYGAEGFLIGGVPATEHSVMCAGTKDDEIGTFKRLMELYPNGLLSVVSDTWDLWKVCTKILPSLKEQILARNGKLVIRPDSGDPVNIICGYNSFEAKDQSDIEYGDFYEYNAVKYDGKLYEYKAKFTSYDEYGVLGEEISEPASKGVVELLWDVFGGTINEQGYKVLNSHIGCIYGDSITLDRADEICKRLEAKGFASTNVVLGIGSYTYQYNTRDTYGFAMKATYVEITEEVELGTDTFTEITSREIFKDPITDSGVKKSAKGLLQVHRTKGAHGMSDYQLKDQCTWEEESEGELQIIFKDGNLLNQTTFKEVRDRINGSYSN